MKGMMDEVSTEGPASGNSDGGSTGRYAGNQPGSPGAEDIGFWGYT